MPNKTIYIPDSSVKDWDDAARLANALGTNLSSVLCTLLRTYVRNVPRCPECDLAPLLPEWKFCPQCNRPIGGSW